MSHEGWITSESRFPKPTKDIFLYNAAYTVTELAAWRGHNDPFYNIIQDLYYYKGGVDSFFASVTYRLSSDDVDWIEAYIVKNEKNNINTSRWSLIEVFHIISIIRKEIAGGRVITYECG